MTATQLVAVDDARETHVWVRTDADAAGGGGGGGGALPRSPWCDEEFGLLGHRACDSRYALHHPLGVPCRLSAWLIKRYETAKIVRTNQTLARELFDNRGVAFAGSLSRAHRHTHTSHLAPAVAALQAN